MRSLVFNGGYDSRPFASTAELDLTGFVVSTKRSRVLFIAHSAQRGGAEYCLDTTLRHLDRERFEPLAVFPHEGPMADAARTLGMDVVIVPLRHWLYFHKNWWFWKNLIGRTLPNIGRLTRLIRERQIDLVYTNTSAIFESALAARRAGVPHLWHVHEILQPGTQMSQLLPLRWIQRLIRRYSSHVVFESHGARQVFEKTTPLKHASVVYNSLRIDPPNHSADSRDSFRKSHGLEDNDITVGFVGQFMDRKNPLVLIEALSQLNDIPNLRCVSAGEGPLKSAMQQQLEAHGLNNRCQILPFQENIVSLLQGIDVLVMPSRQESFGLVLVEAGAAGKPVVACRSQGPDEIIEHGITGLLVDQDNPTALASAIRRLVESSALRLEMGTAARERVCRLFDPVVNTRQLEAIINGLLTKTVATPSHSAKN